jgi:hypothetical protein
VAGGRGPTGVVVERGRPLGVADLDRGVERVAEGDQPPPARADHVGGVSLGVARGEQHVDTGEDLLAVGHGAHLRPQRRENLTRGAVGFGEVTVGPLRFADQEVGAGERSPVAAGSRVPSPAEVIDVQMSEGDCFDVRGAAAERGQVVKQRASVDGAGQVARPRRNRLRAEPGTISSARSPRSTGRPPMLAIRLPESSRYPGCAAQTSSVVSGSKARGLSWTAPSGT